MGRLKKKEEIQQFMRKNFSHLDARKQLYEFNPCIPAFQRGIQYESLSQQMVKKMQEIGIPDVALIEWHQSLKTKNIHLNAFIQTHEQLKPFFYRLRELQTTEKNHYKGILMQVEMLAAMANHSPYMSSLSEADQTLLIEWEKIIGKYMPL